MLGLLAPYNTHIITTWLHFTVTNEQELLYLVVTCDNNHVDPSLSTFFDGINNFSSWWIEHSNNAHECTVCLQHYKHVIKCITALTMYDEILPNLCAVLHVIRNQITVLLSLLTCKINYPIRQKLQTEFHLVNKMWQHATSKETCHSSSAESVRTTVWKQLSVSVWYTCKL